MGFFVYLCGRKEKKCFVIMYQVRTHTVKNTLLVIVSAMVYVVLSQIFSYPMLYDHVVLFLCVSYSWHILFSYRFYVMTRKRLHRLNPSSELEYREVWNGGILNNMYVREVGRKWQWYEVDYGLCFLDFPVTSHVCREFTQRNVTVDDLLRTMETNYESRRYSHTQNLYWYLFFKYVILAIVLLFFFVLFYGSWKHGYYDSPKEAWRPVYEYGVK